MSINRSMKTGVLYGALHSLSNRFGLRGKRVIFMIFRSFIIHNHDRMSSSTRFPHTATWDYITSILKFRLSMSSRVVKNTVMTDINELVQEFWRTSSDECVDVSFFAMRRLLEVLQRCFDNLEVCLFLFPSLPST